MSPTPFVQYAVRRRHEVVHEDVADLAVGDRAHDGGDLGVERRVADRVRVTFARVARAAGQLQAHARADRERTDPVEARRHVDRSPARASRRVDAALDRRRRVRRAGAVRAAVRHGVPSMRRRAFQNGRGKESDGQVPDETGNHATCLHGHKYSRILPP